MKSNVNYVIFTHLFYIFHLISFFQEFANTASSEMYSIHYMFGEFDFTKYVQLKWSFTDVFHRPQFETYDLYWPPTADRHPTYQHRLLAHLINIS